MNIIKLNAIDSTNSFLKELTEKKDLENGTVVVAKDQTGGRGQMGTSWVSEKGKNLTFSMLSMIQGFDVSQQFYCSMAVAVALVEVLKRNVKNSLCIKWPNDILADDKKVSGILIENVLNGQWIKQSVIGIGLNVNQEVFPGNIGHVSSLKLLSGKHFDLDALLIDIVQSLSYYLKCVEQFKFEEIKAAYFTNLYKFNEITVFEDVTGNQFIGKIVGVSGDGRLEIEDIEEKTRKFNLKEINFAGFK